jgi:DNA-directed RNA polymerase specialized sigma24 family protein
MVVVRPLDVIIGDAYGRPMRDRSGGITKAGVVERMSPNASEDVDAREARLLDAVRGGHREAFGTLYELHHDAVFCLARRLTRDTHEADDVVSEVFCNTLRAIRNGRGPRDEARAYLLRSVRHTVTNMRTRKDSGRAIPMADADLDRADTHDPYPMRGPATDAYLDVTDRFREVLWSTEVNGMGNAQVAADQHISGPAAASLAYRARRALRRSYLRGCIRVPIVSDACLETRALLPAFVDGDTATPGAERVRKHIAVCSACDSVLVQLNSVHDRLSNRSGFVASAGALRWLMTDGGRTLLAVIGTSPVVVAAGLGVGALVTTVHSDTAPERTEAAPTTEPVVISPLDDPAQTPPSTAVPTSLATTSSTSPAPTVNTPAEPQSTEPARATITPVGTGEITGMVPGGVDSTVNGGGTRVVSGAGTTVGGITNTVGTTTSSVLGVVEETVGTAVEVQSTTLSIVEPALAAVPTVGQITAPLVPLVEQLGATELALAAATTDQLETVTSGILGTIDTTTVDVAALAAPDG